MSQPTPMRCKTLSDNRIEAIHNDSSQAKYRESDEFEMNKLSRYKWLDNRYNIAQFIKSPMTLDHATWVIGRATERRSRRR